MSLRERLVREMVGGEKGGDVEANCFFLFLFSLSLFSVLVSLADLRMELLLCVSPQMDDLLLLVLLIKLLAFGMLKQVIIGGIPPYFHSNF